MASVDDKMPFMEHLGELRVRIVRSLIALLVGLGMTRSSEAPVSVERRYLISPPDAESTAFAVKRQSPWAIEGHRPRRPRTLQTTGPGVRGPTVWPSAHPTGRGARRVMRPPRRTEE